MTTIATGTATSALSTSVTPELTVNDGVITTTSLQVAQHFGKAHNLVMRSIRNLECSAEFRLCNFAQSSYLNEQGKQQPMFHIAKDGFMFLAMGFTGKEAAQWKEAYIAEFNRREAELIKLQAPADRIPYSVNPTDTLSATQAEQLRLIFKDKCDTLPKDDQAAFMTKGWSKLKSHFGVTYRKIEQREFTEALSLATRHAGEWIAADTVLASPTKNALQSLPMTQAAHEPVKTLDVDTLVSFITGGLIDKQALLKIADAACRVLYLSVTSEKNKGWGEAVASQIDHTLPQSDLSAIVNKAALELWMRSLAAAKPQRTGAHA